MCCGMVILALCFEVPLYVLRKIWRQGLRWFLDKEDSVRRFEAVLRRGRFGEEV